MKKIYYNALPTFVAALHQRIKDAGLVDVELAGCVINNNVLKIWFDNNINSYLYELNMTTNFSLYVPPKDKNAKRLRNLIESTWGDIYKEE